MSSIKKSDKINDEPDQIEITIPKPHTKPIDSTQSKFDEKYKSQSKGLNSQESEFDKQVIFDTHTK